MALSMDLKIYEQMGSSRTIPGGSAAVPSGGGFSQAFSAACQAVGVTDYESCFQAAADTYQVPVNLLKAVAKAESNFTANAVSPCGAQGIMQLMPATARYLGVDNSFDPAQNIMGGAKYLRQMLDRFDGNVSMAVAAYNAGPGAVEKYGGIPPYRETQNYVIKVLGYAGGDISVPAVAVSAGSAAAPIAGAEGYDAAFASTASMTRDELVEQVLRAYRSGGAQDKESTRLLVQQLLSQNEEENGEQGSAVDQFDLKKLALQVEL